jgi:hypothetical protein
MPSPVKAKISTFAKNNTTLARFRASFNKKPTKNAKKCKNLQKRRFYPYKSPY